MGATALEAYANDLETSLTAAVTSATAVSISVASATGAPTSGNFRIRVNNEIMLVTGGHGTTTWTVVRGQEGTTAASSHANGSIVTHVLTAQALINSQLHSQDWTHGTTLHYEGTSVGSTNAVTASAYYSTYNTHYAQQFTGSGVINRVRLFVKSATATKSADVTISLQTNGTGGPSGTLAGSSTSITLPGEFFNTTGRWVSIPFRTTSLGSATYWIVVSAQSADATNYLQLGYTTGTPAVYTSSTGIAGSWSATTNKLSFDVFTGSTGSLINAMEDDALSPLNPTLTAGVNWTELVYDAGGSLTNIYEYLGSFRNTRTLTYDSGVLTGVA